jgi:hypothetical protein
MQADSLVPCNCNAFGVAKSIRCKKSVKSKRWHNNRSGGVVESKREARRRPTVWATHTSQVRRILLRFGPEALKSTQFSAVQGSPKHPKRALGCGRTFSRHRKRKQNKNALHAADDDNTHTHTRFSKPPPPAALFFFSNVPPPGTNPSTRAKEALALAGGCRVTDAAAIIGCRHEFLVQASHLDSFVLDIHTRKQARVDLEALESRAKKAHSSSANRRPTR